MFLNVSIGKMSLTFGKKKESRVIDLKGSGNFFSFMDKCTLMAKKAYKFSTAENYATASQSLEKYCGNRNLLFRDVDDLLMRNFEKYLWNRGISKNTSSCYMRSLRAMYNDAAMSGHVIQNYPFRSVFTGKETTPKRAITKKELLEIRGVRLKPGSREEMARDIFLFCFYACGMPLIDVAYLKKSQVYDGHIVYHRKKTGHQVDLSVLPAMQAIMDAHPSHTDYVFPILSSYDPEEANAEYKRFLKSYNQALLRIEQKLYLPVHIASYVPRHSWATLAMEAKVDIRTIASGLGHSNTNITQVYIKDLEKVKRLTLANQKLYQAIFENGE